MADEKIEVEIVLDDGSIKKGFANIENQSSISSRQASREFDKNFTNRVRGSLSSIGSQAKNVLGGLVAGFAIQQSLSAVVDEVRRFERGLVGVGKTSDISGAQLQSLGSDIRLLSRELPLALDELLELGEAAGRFGVEGSENILTFIDTIGKLNFATDLAGEQGAQSILRILNVTGEGIPILEEFSSVIVSLGNNVKASESEIVRITNEIARGIGVFGVSAGEAAALGATLKELGARAEGSGTAMQKTFTAIDAAISDGGDQIRRFANITGQSVQEFTTLFRKDAFEAVVLFLQGLSELEQSEVSQTLRELGLDSDRLLKVLQPLIANVDNLERSIALSNAELRNASALENEASRAFSTLDADLQILANSFDELQTSIGQSANPALKGFIDLVTNAVNKLNDFFRLGSAQAGGELEARIIQLQMRIESLQDKLNVQGPRAAFIDKDAVREEIKELERLQQQAIQTQRFLEMPTEGGMAGGEGEGEGGGAAATGQGQASDEAVTKVEENLQRLRDKFSGFRLTELQQLKLNQQLQLSTISEANNQKLITERQAFELRLQVQREFQQRQEQLSKNSQAEQLDSLGDFFGQVRDQMADLQGSSGDLINNIARLFTNGIVNGLKAFGEALVTGENAFAALGKQLLKTLGQFAIMVGQFFILAGRGLGSIPFLQFSAAGAIAAGAALIVLGGVLTGLAGGGAGGGGSAGAGGAVGGGATDPITGEPDQDLAEDMEPRQQITVNIQGNVLDRRESGLEIVEILEEAFDTQRAEVTT